MKKELFELIFPKDIFEWFVLTSGESNEAKKVCTECPVKVECLEYALKNKINEGVWGGASERERRRIARQHRKQA